MHQTEGHCRAQSIELNNYCAVASPQEQQSRPQPIMAAYTSLPHTHTSNGTTQGHCRAQSVELNQYCAPNVEVVEHEKRHGDNQNEVEEAEQLKLEEEWGGCCDEPAKLDEDMAEGELTPP